MTAVFEQVTVLGLGLLGGSVALAAKRRGVAARVVGATRRADVREQARRSGAVDAVAEPADAVSGADLVVLATPVAAMGEMTRSIAPGLGAGCVVTDVGSVKAALAETLPGLLPRGVHYVGSHPMAGSHARGFDHARADLFQNAPCAVMDDGDPAARKRVIAFWRALGAHVVVRDAAAHDAEVAWVSHLPHLLAFVFATAFAQAPPSASELRGRGFRDFTRLAESDPELWADILTSNRKALAAPLGAVGPALQRVSSALESDDPEALERLLAAARNALAGARTGTPVSAARPEMQPEPPTTEGSGGARESH